MPLLNDSGHRNEPDTNTYFNCIPTSNMQKLVLTNLDLWASALGFACDTLSWYDDHLCQFNWNPNHAWQVISRTWTYTFTIYIENKHKFQVSTVTLTFERVTQFLHKTRRLHILYSNQHANKVYIKAFENTMYLCIIMLATLSAYILQI